jgi:hypothetical protein
MAHLHELLADRVAGWREAGYPSEAHPTIAEILDYGILPNLQTPRFLRWPQIRALETYWYLRLVENTPHIIDLYKVCFPNKSGLFDALGFASKEMMRLVIDAETPTALLDQIRTDDALVKKQNLESLRETLSLAYPSYIFALAMGAGKTILIAAIIATEFAMALEYPDGDFVKNALVFAPGKTILESLKQLAEVPFDKILPARLYKSFAASLKLTFTRDGEKDLPVIRGSAFNVVVTNTEKIRIQRPTGRNGRNLNPFQFQEKLKQLEEIANLRLQAIASLPHLAVFSDEAHHTYGQALDTELKKVRKTVDYLHRSTNLICVVNTTGTPYFQRQPLRDVVIWYGLSQGIKENILKELAGNLQSFNFDEANTGQFISHVIEDFFRDYGRVRLPNDAPARLAIYFPQTDDLDELRPVVDASLAKLGLSATLALEHTSKTPKENEDAFNRLAHDAAAPHRVILLVNKGTEGWDCPSLFACALARRLKTSNNFVLQAASRCLRQVPGNTVPARVYLSSANEGILDRQLQETYGEKLSDFMRTARERGSTKIKIRKINIPPVVIKQLIRRVVRKDADSAALALVRPPKTTERTMLKATYDLDAEATRRGVLRQIGEVEITVESDALDLYAASVDLAATYHLDPWELRAKLVALYGSQDEIPRADLDDLARQIEGQTRNYELREENVEQALALVKPSGFTKETDTEGNDVYTAEITYPIDREHLLVRWEQLKDKAGNLGFHYTPYNFDSNPEKDFFVRLLDHINVHPAEVEDIYFTGALTDPKKTDFRVEYKGDDERWHDYTPDFVIRKKSGRCLIVEIKSAQFKAATEEDIERGKRGESAISPEGRKALALRRWEELNPERVKYQLAFVAGETVPFNEVQSAQTFVEEKEE